MTESRLNLRNAATGVACLAESEVNNVVEQNPSVTKTEISNVRNRSGQGNSKMKRLVAIFALFALTSLSVNIFAQGSCGDGVNWTISGIGSNQTLIISYTGSGTGAMTNFAYLNGGSFTPPWYSQILNLRTLVIDSGVTSIGNEAFYNCNFTGSLTLPNSIILIGNHAFEDCNGFTGMLTIPNSVTTIGQNAFRNCSGFSGLTIGNSVATIGGWAFESCQGLKGNLIIPNSVDTIGQMAFYGCDGFTGSLTIGNSVKTIGEAAFTSCRNFTGNLVIPNSVTSIGASAFYYCQSFTGTLVIPDSLTTIERSTFRYCRGLTGLTIPNSVKTIGETAFEYCDGLTGNLVIPNSVTSIGANAFAHCNRFTGTLVIPDSLTTIESGTFQYCLHLTGLTIPNSVKTIRANAFYWCDDLTGTLVIPDSVTTIEGSTFQYCSSLTGLTIPNLLDTIGNDAFNNCSGLQGIVSLATVPPALGTNAFYYVPTTIPVTVPSSNASCIYQATAGWNSFTNYSPNCGYTVQWSNTSLTYNGYPQAPTATFTNNLGQSVALSVSGAETNAGTGYTATASAAGVTLTNTTTTFDIAAASVAVQWGNTSLTYNGNPQTPTATATGVLGENLPLSVSGAETNKGSGYTATASLSPTNSNYALSDETTAFTIAPAIVPVQWGKTSLTYNGSPQAPTATATGVLGEDLPLSVSGAETNAGEYTATASLSPTNSNYALSGETTTFSISTKVGFTWQGGTAKCFNIFATNGEDFNVDWGDGTDENQTGTGTNQTVSYSYSADGDFTVTVTGTANCNFGALFVASLQITNLDLSAAYNLKTLYCENNQISSIILPLTPLTFIQCFNNSLQLSDLYAISQTISSAANKRLGTQTLPQLSASIGEELFDAQSVFGGTYTEYEVESATIGTDYEVTDGKLTFLSAGTYTVTMTNAAIVSHASYPAKVLVEIVVN